MNGPASRIVLPLATEDMYAEGVRSAPAAQREVLTFVVAGEVYGVSIADVREIIKPRELTEVPRTPRFLIGVVSVRGLIIPVVDLRLRLRLPTAPIDRASRILVVTREEERFGLLVDEVHGVVRFLEEDVEPPPTTLMASEIAFVAGIGRHAMDGRHASERSERRRAARGAASAATVERRKRIVILLDLPAVLRLDLEGARRKDKPA